MSDPLSALLLGIIEGLTEFLPVSSTGHLLIAEQWLGHRSDFFNIVIQAGAILATMLVYRQRLWTLATGLGEPANRDYVFKLSAAFLVTAVVGLTVRKAGWQLPESVHPVAWALVIGGVWMLAAEQIAGRLPERETVTWKVAIAVGLAQVVAGVFPGTSRSATTIFLAMLLGLSKRSAAADFAFLVGIPTMFAASGYSFLELYKHGALGSENWGDVSIAFAAALVTGFMVVRWLLGYIKSHRFTAFAAYRIVLGAALLLWLPAA
ncbi:undecaprenyl-diphosphate phosphatase [Xanthomonas albilineans]|uniref:Undecaprenyl-diphosphatase n=1 Tax=Xanthomonas albilineans (strain GPE PC73 / CFBP 7063) TaxID=380358 RepID=D2UGR0_XANAP|nr:undecaprenyl-diphosphate phosphatase [Xanthomonas albilineans]PPU91858.1 undecaprenyl-diphosphate phosphatase [Xanthomonas albilineans]QHQ29831.1 putative undecaprenyl-diphosphatase protein [Xanthomonas albilineans]CBA17571.1 probable undecaprenyl-diphosphatase protein [Xanthomonas albilineans GPE PC73]